MPESFEVEAIIPAGPERVYAAWLDAKEHGAFTGAPALVEPWVGGRFTAHDGYLHGITLQLEPGKRIVQSWRSTEFPQGTPDSRIYVELTPVKDGTRIHIKHVDVPMGQARLYKPGWAQHYFKSMIKYFAAKPPKAGKAAEAKAAPAARRAPGAAPAGTRPTASAVAKRSAAPAAAKRSPAASVAKGAPARRASSRSAAARAPGKRAAGRPAKPAHASPARAKPGKARSSSKKAARKARR